MTQSICKASLFGRHKFQARYDTRLKEPLTQLLSGLRCTESMLHTLVTQANIEKTYVCDVCAHCGEVIRR